MSCQGSASAGTQRPCGVRTSYYAVCRGFPRVSTVQWRYAARTCRIRSTRLLAALKPLLRRLFWRRRDSSTLPAHGRYRPVTPIFLLFPRKEGKQEKRIIGDSDNCAGELAIGTGMCYLIDISGIAEENATDDGRNAEDEKPAFDRFAFRLSDRAVG